jgi:hypothetical protein
VTLVPASQARRIARRSSSTSPPHTPCEPMPNACRSESSRQSGRTGQRAQTAMACAAWSRALATSQVMGNQASGSTRELAHRASRYTRPANSRSVRSCGSRRTRRGLEAISPGCTSCPSASFIAPSSPRPRRPRIPSPVSRGSRPGRTGRWPRSGAPRIVPSNSLTNGPDATNRQKCLSIFRTSANAASDSTSPSPPPPPSQNRRRPGPSPKRHGPLTHVRVWLLILTVSSGSRFEAAALHGSGLSACAPQPADSCSAGGPLPVRGRGGQHAAQLT